MKEQRVRLRTLALSAVALATLFQTRECASSRSVFYFIGKSKHFNTLTQQGLSYKIRKAPTPNVDAPSKKVLCPYGHCLSCVRDRIGIFIFAYFFYLD